ncbi:MAG: L,D-transpeptidase, partial [Frankiaceae bacterium]|nr:L,D-transpeptidase [Arenimonas sp.]
ILLIDYDASIALHPVVKGQPIERRAERLQSPTAQDNRISFGCINVPLAFYQSVVSPVFGKTNGVVYILPEASSAQGWFEKKLR